MADFRGDTWLPPAAAALQPGPFTRLVEVVDRTHRIDLRTATLETQGSEQGLRLVDLIDQVVRIDARVDPVDSRLFDHDRRLNDLHADQAVQREQIRGLEERLRELEAGALEVARDLVEVERRLQAQIDAQAEVLDQHERRIEALEDGWKSASSASAKPRK